jgi:CheY-like chemotaxis protein
MATRVLVVEDEEETAELLRDLLREFGYEPLLVRSAEAARSALDTERPDVILLDLRLPLMSGLDFLQIDRVRAAGPPIVVVSGVATEEEARECLLRGALDFVGKPLNADLLRQVLLYAEVQSLRTHQDDERRAADRRRSARPPLTLPVRIFEYNGAERKGICVDLSTFGMKLRPLESVTPGPAVRLYFRPLDGGPGLYLLAILVRREGPDTYAFRFVNLTESEFERLRNVVAGVGESP